MSAQLLRVTGYLSLGGVQYPFDETLAIGQTVNFNNASCAYHLSLTTNAGGLPTPELWVDSFIGANLPMYGEVIVNPPAGFSGATIADRSSTANLNQGAATYYDGTQGGSLQLAAPWTVSSYAFSNSGIFPTQSFGMGVANSSGFTAPALFLGFGAQFTLPPPVAPAEAMTVLENSTANSVTPTITLAGSPVAADSMTVVTQPAHGIASASNAALFYTPLTGYAGADSFTYDATVGGQVSNTATVSVTVTKASAPDCTELGRVTRANVSGYQRARVQYSRLVRGEKRCLVANFNGAFDPARTIASVTWRCEQPYYVGMANARLPNAGQFAHREAAVDITAQLQGFAWIKCEATLDNGEIYTQVFTVAVMNTPYFFGETFPTLGPYVLTATAQ